MFPSWTKESKREYNKAYYKSNKEVLKERVKKYRDNHQEWLSKYQKAYYKQNKEKWIENGIFKRYGITFSQWYVLFEKQNFSCAICGAVKSSINKSFHVDHSHISGKIRGILCHNCNVGIGNFKDDVNVMQKAIIYLNTKEDVYGKA